MSDKYMELSIITSPQGQGLTFLLKTLVNIIYRTVSEKLYICQSLILIKKF